MIVKAKLDCSRLLDSCMCALKKRKLAVYPVLLFWPRSYLDAYNRLSECKHVSCGSMNA